MTDLILNLSFNCQIKGRLLVLSNLVGIGSSGRAVILHRYEINRTRHCRNKVNETTQLAQVDRALELEISYREILTFAGDSPRCQQLLAIFLRVAFSKFVHE